jgi:hypothetical protein
MSKKKKNIYFDFEVSGKANHLSLFKHRSLTFAHMSLDLNAWVPQALEVRTPLFPHLVPPAIMVWIFVWKYIFEPFIHMLQHFMLQLSRGFNCRKLLHDWDIVLNSCCRSSLNLLQQSRKWISSSTSPESNTADNLNNWITLLQFY